MIIMYKENGNNRVEFSGTEREVQEYLDTAHTCLAVMENNEWKTNSVWLTEAYGAYWTEI